MFFPCWIAETTLPCLTHESAASTDTTVGTDFASFVRLSHLRHNCKHLAVKTITIFFSIQQPSTIIWHYFTSVLCRQICTYTSRFSSQSNNHIGNHRVTNRWDLIQNVFLVFWDKTGLEELSFVVIRFNFGLVSILKWLIVNL